MIQSMTAFARSVSQIAGGSLTCEIRSINHRYLELYLRLPEIVSSKESDVREKIRQYLKRGKIECYLRYQPEEQSLNAFTLNTALLDKLITTAKDINNKLPNTVINSLDLLKWPGVVVGASLADGDVQKAAGVLLEETLQDLIKARSREGSELKRLLIERLNNMVVVIHEVKLRLPLVLQQQRERLVTRFNEAKISLDADRLEQELLLVAQKMDVEEEIDRLNSHMEEVKRILNQGGAVGRRLDFLMQELHREANTLGAKSYDAETTRASVELKVLIEQMREQVQNIE